jgi:8-oxo-dGTP diphosphatase
MTMPEPQPFVITARGTRRFACSAVALQSVVVSCDEKILLLSSPDRNPGAWQTASGAMEAGETILDGVLRETREELGADLRLRPLGTVHVQSFHYDEKVQYMIAIYYLLAYEGGEVQPGDDMLGSQYRWWSLAELADEKVKVVVPPGQKWIFERAIELYRLWKDGAWELQLADLWR